MSAAALLVVGAGASSSELAATVGTGPTPAPLSRYDEAMQASLYDEAADAAAAYITTLLKDPKHSRRDWADALVRLGDAQRLAADHESAIANYQLAIDTLDDNTDRLDAVFIEPTQRAAEAMIAARQFNRAARLLERVVHLRQVNFGPNDLEQCDALDLLSNVYLMIGDDRRALARQQARLGVYDQHYPGDDLRKLPALFSQAELLTEIGALVDSHTSYRRIISMIERADGPLSPELLSAFYRISELLSTNTIKDGYAGTYKARRYLRRAVYIADKSDEVSTLQRADAHIAMGDFLAINTLDRDAALRRYRSAWHILAADDQLRPELETRFGEPRLLNETPSQASPIMRILYSSLEYRVPQPGARLLVRFNVDNSGLPRNIEVIEADPAGYWDSLIVDHVGKFVYRPKIEDGEPIASDDLLWEMPYLAQDEDLLD